MVSVGAGCFQEAVTAGSSQVVVNAAQLQGEECTAQWPVDWSAVEDYGMAQGGGLRSFL